MKDRYTEAVINMLKQVCNVEVVIGGIITKCEGQIEKEVKKLYPEETHYICKKDKNAEPIIKGKSQYELKQRKVETIKGINERIMKEKEEIKMQFDQLKEHHQKDKQKEQQKVHE